MGHLSCIYVWLCLSKLREQGAFHILFVNSMLIFNSHLLIALANHSSLQAFSTLNVGIS